MNQVKENNMSTFGEKVRKLRINKNLTTRMLSEQLGISHGQITKYENNLSEPTLTALNKYKEFFKVSLDYLCDDTQE
jgi:transcriptional regulator with XRE-family HTH domain